MATLCMLRNPGPECRDVAECWTKYSVLHKCLSHRVSQVGIAKHAMPCSVSHRRVQCWQCWLAADVLLCICSQLFVARRLHPAAVSFELIPCMHSVDSGVLTGMRHLRRADTSAVPEPVDVATKYMSVLQPLCSCRVRYIFWRCLHSRARDGAAAKAHRLQMPLDACLGEPWLSAL